MDIQIDYKQLYKTLKGVSASTDLFTEIVNAPFEYKLEMTLLNLGIIVLLILNKKRGEIERIALSNTDLANLTTRVSAKPFKKIKIKADNPENIIARAIRMQECQDTTDWKYLFTPALRDVDARMNQSIAGISYSAVYPFMAMGGGALIFSYFQFKDQIGEQQKNFMEEYTSLVDKALRARN